MNELTLNARFTEEDWDRLMVDNVEDADYISMVSNTGKRYMFIPLSVLYEVRNLAYKSSTVQALGFIDAKIKEYEESEIWQN